MRIALFPPARPKGNIPERRKALGLLRLAWWREVLRLEVDMVKVLFGKKGGVERSRNCTGNDCVEIYGVLIFGFLNLYITFDKK